MTISDAGPLDPFITADRRPALYPLAGRPAPPRSSPVLKDGVLSVPVLDPTQAADVRTTVFDLRAHWRQVGSRLAFYTLGAASYIDAARDHAEYHRLAEYLNPILSTHFSDLYDRVFAALSDALGLPVAAARGFALPGFHVYQSHPELALLQPQVHLDLQYQKLDWSSVGTPHLDHALSFTLAISLPATGAGLNVWPPSFANGRSAAPGPEAKAGATYHPYNVGHLVIHSGARFHQIAPMPDLQPGEERLTLQGHGLWCGKEWLVYW